jgi:adenylate cyclase
VKAIRNVLGTAAASDDEHVREDDAAIFRLAVRAKELGGDDEQLARGFRTMADAVRRSVRVQRDFIDEVLIQPVIASGASESQALQTTAAVRREYRTIGADLMMLLLRRFMDDAIFQGIVELGERALQRDGTDHARAPSAPAIVFVDVSGYTSLAEKSGDEAAAHSAARFASLVDDIGSAHGGHLVKLLGDGAMLAFPSAASAVRCGFELIARARQEGLPPLHIGVDAGAVVRRDGDYFGSVVNIASRVADRAGPGQLLVTDKVVSACDDEHDLRFTVTGPAVLKNVARPITLYLAGTAS